MNKILRSYLIPVFTLLFASLNGISQTEFENGYFVKEDGTVVQSLVQLIKKSSTPLEFKYKLREDGEIKIGRIEEIKEFGIKEKFKYERANINIALLSTLDPSFTSSNETRKEVFLRTLLEGETSLYEYANPNSSAYFFKKGSGEMQLLKYNRNASTQEELKNRIDLQRQLWDNLQCEEITTQDVVKVEYTEKKLVKFFEDYNECKQVKTTKYKTNEKFKVHLNITPGINFSTYTNDIEDYTGFPSLSETNFRIGLEAEFVLPIAGNRWSIILEPTYESFSGVLTSNDGDRYAFASDVKYQSINIPLGVRHYFPINQDSKLHVNLLAVIYDINLGSEVVLSRTSLVNGSVTAEPPLALPKKFQAAIGAGYNFKKFSIEGRYYVKQAFYTQRFINAQHSAFAVIFGYQIF